MHVGIETRIHQRGGIDLARLGMRNGLVDECRIIGQEPDEDRNGRLIHCKCHEFLLVGIGIDARPSSSLVISDPTRLRRVPATSERPERTHRCARRIGRGVVQVIASG